MDIVIPLNFKAGKFKYNELNGGDEELTLCYNEQWELLTYDAPEYENEVRIYTVPKELMPGALTAVYGDGGELEKVELSEDGRTRLIYVRYADSECSKTDVLKFIEEQADKVAGEITARGQKLSRLFFGRFYDGEAVEISVKTATAEEVQAVIDEYDGDTEAADNSGDYPVESMIAPDCETLGVMLMCTDCDFQSELFDLAASVFEERIKERVLDKIDKNEDFKVISEECD